MNPDLGIPVSLALALWKNAQKVPHPPSLDVLQNFSDADVVELIDRLYLVSLEMYKKHKSIRVLLCHTTAPLIIYHPKVVKDLGANSKLARKLVQSVVTAGLGKDQKDTQYKLGEWYHE